MRLGVRLGAVDEYELGRSPRTGSRAGGVANTSTPNYVYRWTEREVAKTVASFAPHARHRLRFFREFELPDVLADAARGPRGSRCARSRPAVGVVDEGPPGPGEPVRVRDREAAAAATTCSRGCGCATGGVEPDERRDRRALPDRASRRPRAGGRSRPR